MSSFAWKAVESGNVEDLVVALEHLDPDDEFLSLNNVSVRRTPTYVAARKGHAAIIEKLFEFGVRDIDTQDDLGSTPMHVAAYNNHISVMETLMRLGCTTIDALDDNGWTPMFSAIVNGNTMAVEALVRLGSKAIDVPDYDSWTPVAWTAAYGFDYCCDTLKMLGADCSITPVNSVETSRKLDALIDEHKSEKLRNRVYFSRSLMERLLLELEMRRHLL